MGDPVYDWSYQVILLRPTPSFVIVTLHRRIATVLKLEPSLVEVERPLHELGLDSLTAFELKNRIETELGVTLPVGQFLQRPTISALVAAVMATMHGDTRPVADAVGPDDFGPAMSFGQEALWFIDRLDPGNPAYGLVACVSFRPHLDEEFLDQNVQKILLYNEHLRFAFPSDGIGPVPKLLPPERYRLIRHDATGLSETAFSRLLQAEANRPFDLAEGPLNRLHLFRRSDRDVLLLQFHHIVADAASIALLMDEVFEGYFALQAGLPLPPPRQRSGFGRFVAWQRALVAGPQGASHRAFWREQLAGAPPSLPLSTDHPRPTNPLGPGAARSFKVTNVVVEELKGLARAEGTTLFSVLLTALNVLLHRHSGARDIVVGTPMSGRTRPEFEEMVGYLVNALPIRTQISGGESFGSILAKVDATVRAALEHQDYPFPMIVRDVEPARQPGSFPIFQIMFGMERFHSTDRRGYAATLLNMAGPAIKERGYTVESVTVERNRAPFDLSFTIEEFNDQIFGVVDYRRDLWDEETIARLVDDYQTILHQVVASPFRAVTEFVLDQEGAKPLCGRELQERPDILTSLCAAAAARPDAIALSDVAGDLAYGALLDRVARVAGALTERALGRGARVGICLGRSRDLPIAMLAALSSGAAYVPLDPSYPRQRLAAIIADASPDIVIADRASAAALPGGVPLLLTDDLANAGPAVSPVAVEADDLAYVIHTSGSTGQPAGVEIERGALANFLAAMRAELPLSPATRSLPSRPIPSTSLRSNCCFR